MIVLSIIIPTYNRKELLLDTLSLFKPQVIRNSKRVNLIIGNNASTDGTEEALKELHEKSPFFEYINFTNHVEVGDSITRTNDLATGEFVVMWGDDDWPVPFFIDYILESVDKYPDADLFHYNRLCGKDSIDGMKSLFVQRAQIGKEKEMIMTVKECVDKYVLDMSFLTTNVFRRQYWVHNKSLDCTRHYGYEFMGHILHGMNNSKAVYLQFPICIQRWPSTRSWMSKSPLYRFVGIPNMYNDFEEWGLTDNAKTLWMKQGNSFKSFLIMISQTSLFKKVYRPLFKEIISHQYSLTRKIIAFFFIFLCPAFIYRCTRKIIY